MCALLTSSLSLSLFLHLFPLSPHRHHQNQILQGNSRLNVDKNKKHIEKCKKKKTFLSRDRGKVLVECFPYLSSMIELPAARNDRGRFFFFNFFPSKYQHHHHSTACFAYVKADLRRQFTIILSLSFTYKIYIFEI